MTKFMLVGGAGFLGSYIAKKLLADGDEVVIHDGFLNYISPFKSRYHNLLQLRFENLLDKVKLIRGDIRHKGRFLKILREESPDVLINLAALPIATVSNEYSEDAMGINLNGAVNVLEALREVEVKRFVYTSSSMVYGNFVTKTASEDHPKNPMDVYGGTKLAGEILTRVFSSQYGINYTIIRPSAVYGPTDANRRVTQIFVDNALAGKPLILHNKGKSKLDFTFVEDIALGYIQAAKSKKGENETFNLTRGEGRSLKELADIIKKLIPSTVIEYKEAAKEEKRPERGALDISKAKKLIGYDPKHSLEDGMNIYVDFAKMHRSK